MLARSYFFKNSNPSLAWHFWKVNTCPHFIIDDFKISSIHNQTLLRENNKGGCLSKTWINNCFMLELCYLQIERKKILEILLAVTNNQYAFSVFVLVHSDNACARACKSLVSFYIVKSLPCKLKRIKDFLSKH